MQLRSISIMSLASHGPSKRSLATLSLAAASLASPSLAQELRVFAIDAAAPQVQWDATSNLGPLGAFFQSYSFGGDIVVDFDATPSLGRARITGARLVVPNSVVAALMGGPGIGDVAFRDLELDATSPDFLITPAFPASLFATSLDLSVKSGIMLVNPPFGPAFQVSLAGLSLGSLPVSGSFPTVGPAQRMTLGPFDFDMPFSAPGWTGSFTHHVPGLAGLGGCPAPESYCPPDPNSLGGGTELRALGSTSVAADDFTLAVTHAPASTFGVCFHGGRRHEAQSGAGLVCVGGPLVRLGVVATDVNGAASLRVLLANQQAGPVPLEPGAHAYFQFFHRVTGPTGPSWNYSNAVAVTFCP